RHSPTSHTFFIITRHSPRSTLFPYTTLFRSSLFLLTRRRHAGNSTYGNPQRDTRRRQPARGRRAPACHAVGPVASIARPRSAPRSEEHTSELQSRENLVCRLLLEKKNEIFHA